MKLLKRWIKRTKRIRDRRKVFDYVTIYEEIVDNYIEKGNERELSHYRDITILGIGEIQKKAMRYVGRYYTKKKFKKEDISNSELYCVTFKPVNNG